MTPAELKENLLKQFDEAVANVRRIEGALAACNELLKEEEQLTDEPVEETTADD